MKLSLSKNINRLRRDACMTQEQLAEALGVTFAAVSKWERGMAVPELNYIAEMADLFGVSMDAMVGYRVQNGACEALEERIHKHQQAKEFDAAAAEAEKALSRYPNDFRLVYRCGEMYQLKGIESNDKAAIERAIELWNHAVLLLPQNTNPEINEGTIRTGVALCYFTLGKKEQGLELLKKHNTNGIHNSLIGLNYAISDGRKPEEAAPYLTKAFCDCITTLVRTMIGYANCYARMGDYESALESVLWLIQYLASVKADGSAVSYVDKICAPFYAECAHLSDLLGRAEDVEPYLRKAFSAARSFDAAPSYNFYNIRFCIGEVQTATAYDDIGATAMEAIENQLQREGWNDRLRAVWQKLKEEV